MGAEKTFSSAELERLLLRRRRQEAVEGLRSLSAQPGDQSGSSEVQALSPAGLTRPGTLPSLNRATVAHSSASLAPPLLGQLAGPVEEEWLRPPLTHLRPTRKRRRRRFSHPMLVALKEALGRVVDTLIILVMILFVIALGFFVYDNYIAPRLYGSGGASVQAQGSSTPWQGQGYLSSPDEAMLQVPLPFVPYSTTVELKPAFVPAPTPAPGTVRPTRLVIPRIQLDTPVDEVTIQDGVWQVAEYAAGYHRGTARPGTVGNTVISGHKGLKGAVFRRLGELGPGDEIFLYADIRLYRYVVQEQKSVWPHQVEVMAQTPTPILTLITCTTYDTQRLIIVAPFDRELTGTDPGP